MKLAWTRSAREDRRSIHAFIGIDSIRAANKMDQIFAEKAEMLIRYPEIGRQGRVQGTREFLAHRHYFLIYRVHENTIQILRLLHTSRQWPLNLPSRH